MNEKKTCPKKVTLDATQNMGKQRQITTEKAQPGSGGVKLGRKLKRRIMIACQEYDGSKMGPLYLPKEKIQ